ncbi:MAG: rod shape-determining protein MreB [Thermacetogeniaceae bacterium]
MFWAEDIGVDLGTASVLVYVRGKGIVLNEPSVIAIDRNTDNIIAVGEEARQMLGRTPGSIVASRPLRDGVIADYDVTERMLRYFIQKAIGQRFFFRPRVMVCIPSGVTSVEERAARQAAVQAGARQAFLIEEPLAAALGAGIDISEASGNMVIDVGGGTTDIAIISLGGIVCSKSLRVGGDKFDEAIIRHVRKEYNLMIGERTAEDLKIRVGTSYLKGMQNPDEGLDVRGRDLITGLPKTVNVTSKVTAQALTEPLEQVMGSVKEVLERTPPELSADIVSKGIVLTGGGGLLHGFDMLLSERTGLPVHIAENPISCVALGTGKALAMLNYLQSAQSVAVHRAL